MRRTALEEAADQQHRGILAIITGPTGSGKDTVLNKLQLENPHMVKVITTTSRSMRENESEGKPYHFFSREEFERKIEEHAFFEWVEFRGELYGTQKKTLTDALVTGADVIWRIDTRGVKNIKQKVNEMFDRAVFIFLASPVEVLEQRVHRDEGEHGFAKRWNKSLVSWEMDQYEDCDYLVYNEEDTLDRTMHQVKAIMDAKRREIVRKT